MSSRLDKLIKSVNVGAPQEDKAIQARFDRVEKLSELASNKLVADISSQLLLLPIDQLTSNPFNSRVSYQEDIIKERALSIAAEGQMQPIKVALRLGEKVIIDGHYRVKALEHLRQKEVSAVIVDMGELSEASFNQYLYKQAFITNHERAAETSFDHAISWKRLLDSKTFANVNELGLATSVSESTISKTLKLLGLPEVVMEHCQVSGQTMGLTVAYALSQYCEDYLVKHPGGELDLLMVARKLTEGEYVRRDIDQLRERLLKPAKKNSQSRRFKINKSQTNGFIQDWDDGRVILSIKIDDRKDQLAILEALKKQFGIE